MKKNGTFKIGDWVEVRSKAEILCTLDANGQLDKMPFMPEMLQYLRPAVPSSEERT